MVMTSSIANSKEKSKNGKKYKSQKFMTVSKFWKLKKLSFKIADSVIFSDFTKDYQKVRKLTIWLNQQEIQISTFGC